jgi:hypothetical protein
VSYLFIAIVWTNHERRAAGADGIKVTHAPVHSGCLPWLLPALWRRAITSVRSQALRILAINQRAAQACQHFPLFGIAEPEGIAFCVREGRMSNRDQASDYKTHILIGRQADGVMTIIGDWSHVPTQTDVQEAIDGTPGTFANFAHCTPTSVLPGKRGVEEKKVPSRFGVPSPTRRP